MEVSAAASSAWSIPTSATAVVSASASASPGSPAIDLGGNRKRNMEHEHPEREWSERSLAPGDEDERERHGESPRSPPSRARAARPAVRARARRRARSPPPSTAERIGSPATANTPARPPTAISASHEAATTWWATRWPSSPEPGERYRGGQPERRGGGSDHRRPRKVGVPEARNRTDPLAGGQRQAGDVRELERERQGAALARPHDPASERRALRSDARRRHRSSVSAVGEDRGRDRQPRPRRSPPSRSRPHGSRPHRGGAGSARGRGRSP